MTKTKCKTKIYQLSFVLSFWSTILDDVYSAWIKSMPTGSIFILSTAETLYCINIHENMKCNHICSFDKDVVGKYYFAGESMSSCVLAQTFLHTFSSGFFLAAGIEIHRDPLCFFSMSSPRQIRHLADLPN